MNVSARVESYKPRLERFRRSKRSRPGQNVSARVESFRPRHWTFRPSNEIIQDTPLNVSTGRDIQDPPLNVSTVETFWDPP